VQKEAWSLCLKEGTLEDHYYAKNWKNPRICKRSKLFGGHQSWI